LPLTIKEARRLLQLRIADCELRIKDDREKTIEEHPEQSAILTPYAGTRQSAILRAVWFGYGGREVLRGLSLEIRAGEITALMGRNGAGKTTILKLITGLLKPSRGSVDTMGLDTRRASLDDISKLVGYVPQQPDLLLFADTVQAEVDFTRKTHGLPPDGAELLAGLGLTPYRASDPRDLSVGERQRVALAAVLSGNPQALILDEPTRGLDYLQKDSLVGILRNLRDEGRAVILATHDVELAARLADRVILLGDGEIIADGPAREVMTGSLVFSTQISKLFRDPALLTMDDVNV
jgi:energy-coupling factor transport system ATP-binding protein